MNFVDKILFQINTELEANGDFNKGTATLKEIAGYFENVFSIDIGDLYHSYLEMRSRKINRTRYLETLQKGLLRRMDENDA
ncbi:RteC domain-containing protein [uncultured Parabacteroides sp.]|uniref:RteC domain-containing protein n=1 Tax=uncultured Parabacteroides sp. TaxID=512312 RepID=UPI00260BED03|nr:RteC domain-containing protein [uncultured Parabacteroides sp.]